MLEEARRRVTFLMFDNCLLAHVAGPMAAFELAGQFDLPIYDQSFVSSKGGLVRTSCGLEIMTGPAFEAPVADKLFVAGGFGVVDVERELALLDHIRSEASRGAQIAAISSAAGLVAQTGLLDGLRATTHWSLQAEMARLHPKINIIRDSLIVHDGQFWTCGRSAGGIEIARQMIEADLGTSVARRATKDLIAADRRAFSASGQGDGRYEPILKWAREHLREVLTVGDLARQCGLTERHFLSDFLAHSGETPAKAIERLRLDAAMDLIETSEMPLSAIAVEVGFRQPERMRRAFLRGFGQSPSAMRAAFVVRDRKRS